MSRVSENDTSTKSCFSGILRRILCTGSLPTHPSNSDIVPESDAMIFQKKNSQATPGVVARLMGLESLPDIKWIPKDAINFRSKSARSADYLTQFDHLSQHRRVKTSVSFREIPTFLHPHNEDLFVVCYQRNNNNATGFQNTKRSCKNVNGEIKEGVAVKKKKRQENKKRNPQPRRRCLKASNLLPYYNKSDEVYIRSSPRLKEKTPTNSCCVEVSSRMKHARMESTSNTGSTSESSSTTEISGKIGLMKSNAKKKNSIPKHDKVEYPCPNQQVTSANQITKTDGIDFYMKKFVQVCRLNEQDTKNCHDWRWINSESIRPFDVCLDLEQHILDSLLQQVVDELCLVSLS